MEIAERIITITELIGIIVFAISGAMAGIKKKLDIFGVIVLGITTALGGGVVRDLLLGKVPPMMFQKPVYVLLAMIFSIITFCFILFVGEMGERQKEFYDTVLNFLDAVGLGVFAATSVNTVVSSEENTGFFLAVFMGTITAVGGGIIRDMMSNEIPMVLRKRIYAVAAIIGSMVYYWLYQLYGGTPFIIVVSILVTVVIRVLAKHYRWNLPRIKSGD